jgi:hypothetical protein
MRYTRQLTRDLAPATAPYPTPARTLAGTDQLAAA